MVGGRMVGFVGSILLIESLLLGLRIVYGIEACGDRDGKFYEIWKNRSLYVSSAILAVATAVIYFGFHCPISAIRVTDMVLTFVILALVDHKCQIVPDRILACFLFSQLLLGLVSMYWRELLYTMATGIGFAVILVLLVTFSKRKMGWGDVKLLAITAMVAGWGYALQLLALAMIPAFFYSVWLLLFRKYSMKMEFAFVPFLALGMIGQIAYMLVR